MSAVLRGLVVVVTGACGAAGPPVVSRLVEGGATVVAVDRDPDLLERLAGEVSGPGRVETAVVDLLDEPATLAWGHQVSQDHGHVDGLVHLVGGWRGGQGIVEVDLADYDWLHDGLVRTLQHTTRALHDPLRESPHGRLAIISTTGLAKPTAKNAVYLTAKAASEAWVMAVAHSFKETSAAACVLRAKALLTPAMREEKPEAKFTGYTPVDELAERITGLWDLDSADVNGQVVGLTA